MAGPDPTGAFDPDEFRVNIRAVMLMGLPEDTALRPTFHFPKVVDNANPDPANRPWDFNQPKVTDTTPAAVQVICGVKVKDGTAGYNSAGKFDAREATLTFFEDEWAAVDGFSHVMIGLKKFRRAATLEPQGLFEVTVHKVEVIAEDN